MKSLRGAAQKITGGVQPISMLNLAQILNLSRPISLKAICNGADFFGKYIFRLDHFKITNTRAFHNDTDYVSFTLKVGDNQPETQTKFMGDKNNGTYDVGLEFGPISIGDPNTLVVFNYQIANSGHNNPSQMEQILGKGSDELLKPDNVKQIMAAGEEGGVWGLIAAGALVAFAELIHLLLGLDCDGLVAADEIVVTGATLKDWISSGYHEKERHYHGEVKCNPAGSDYYVTWSVRSA